MKWVTCMEGVCLKPQGSAPACKDSRAPRFVFTSPHCLAIYTGFLFLKDFSCGAEAVYCNVINLAPWKEDDFAIYANMPRFDWPPRTRLPPDQVEYASIVFR